MNKYVAAYAGAIVMVVLDMLWLGVIAKPLYPQGIGHLLAERSKVGVAVLFYLLYGRGVVIFAVSPRHGSSRGAMTLTMGAPYGLFGWGTEVSTTSAAGEKAVLSWATRASP
ncbi:MAG: hypothetical protein H6R06_2021 [Proteobacteria bacterium]|jgi:uncharacterized membrane protein|nr:hypothetical protein [Pseudomonadota bacterium]